MTHSDSTTKKTRTCKSTTKSGCRTCKLRKVKCDEGFPACRRCQTAGRACEGYGIWGGGNDGANEVRQRPAGAKIGPFVGTDALTTRPAAGPSLLSASTEERQHLDWFKCRTVPKLPGSFPSGFWSTLLIQAILSEPAVLHATIALSSVQRTGVLQIDCQDVGRAIPDKHEQFTLQHYVKAIRNLRPRFLAQDQASFRVALVACIVFVSLDFLRGHFTTGLVHFRNGLRLLEGSRMISRPTGERLCIQPGRDSVDDWIVEAFSRLHLQIQLFSQPHQQPCFFLTSSCPNAPVRPFHSLREAWHELDRLLNLIFDLSKRARDHQCAGPLPLHLYKQQYSVEADLVQWLEAYETFTQCRPADQTLREQKRYRIICVHHTMAAIMAAVCLCPGDEMAFDAHTDLFARLLSQLDDIRKLHGEVHVSPPGHRIHMAGSIVDMGCIAPLYYTAVKCRVHQLRLRAIRHLETTFHREGIWDSKITARVARKVMQTEERRFYHGISDAAENIPGSSVPLMSPGAREHSLAPLPQSCRLRDVEMVLSGDPTDKVFLYCRLKRHGADCRVRIAEYHLASQLWLDQVDRNGDG